MQQTGRPSADCVHLKRLSYEEEPEKDKTDRLIDDLKGLIEAIVDSRASMNNPEFEFSDLVHMGIRMDAALLRLKSPLPATTNKNIWIEDILFKVLEFIACNADEGPQVFVKPFLSCAQAIAFNRMSVFGVEKSTPLDEVNLDTLTKSILEEWVSVEPSEPGFDKSVRQLRPHSASQFPEAEGSQLYIAETGSRIGLGEYMWQPVAEMFLRGKSAGKHIVRGVLTNGYQWKFLVVKLDDQGGGAFNHCMEIDIRTTVTFDGRHYELVLSKPTASLLPYILAHWMTHPYEDLDDDDYLKYPTQADLDAFFGNL